MTDLELYKFITENKIEWHRHETSRGEDVVILPSFSQMEDFIKICSYSLFDDGGIECILKHGYLVIFMRDICDWYDIDMNSVFDGKDCEYV